MRTRRHGRERSQRAQKRNEADIWAARQHRAIPIRNRNSEEPGKTRMLPHKNFFCGGATWREFLSSSHIFSLLPAVLKKILRKQGTNGTDGTNIAKTMTWLEMPENRGCKLLVCRGVSGRVE